MAKGSGMIMPNMATMLCFLTTDAAISAEMLKKALNAIVCDTFNMVSVDGDTSTNDMCSILASGLAGNCEITAEGADFDTFKSALFEALRYLSREIARDGEGATKLIECVVKGAKDIATAKTVAKSVINSSLLKAAMFGADANWGRVLCAIGYSGADLNINGVDVDFKSCKGTIAVCRNGAGIEFDEDIAKTILLENEIIIDITLSDGDAQATAWGCDLTYDYVKINGDYRS
jgi:glutamate N-acetyltransferase/amino-acid N-acetyltransferase